MRAKVASIICAYIISILITSCSAPQAEIVHTNGINSNDELEISNVYDVGYDDGYSQGFEEGYDIGVESAMDSLDDYKYHFVEKSIDTITDMGYCHPDDAVEIIDAYRNNKPYYSGGGKVSKEDYNQAIDALIMYYYN